MKTYERIRQRREELGMSQDELAVKSGYLNRSSIARIERGDTDIPQSKLEDIARALRVTPSYLMGWEDIVIEDNGLPKLLSELTALQEETIELFFELNATNQKVASDVIKSLHQTQNVERSE